MRLAETLLENYAITLPRARAGRQQVGGRTSQSGCHYLPYDDTTASISQIPSGYHSIADSTVGGHAATRNKGVTDRDPGQSDSHNVIAPLGASQAGKTKRLHAEAGAQCVHIPHLRFCGVGSPQAHL